ncbi:MAG TPA: SDR family NAD(P)-dependent oxidoreductase [Vicinamibacterales bacterium]|nr:SDR family NAD(P)-dependent oxidoreductase [Vicinamibacterales bacterium]
MTTRSGPAGGDIAIIGMSLRFPGAETVEEFWQNLRHGVESVTFFTDEELLAAGTSPAMLADPNFVRAQPALKNVEAFDAAFFGFKPREAEAMDPQLRVFLECAWEALERAGYDPNTCGRSVSVYAGNNISNYFIFNVLPMLDVLSSQGSLFGIVSYNDKDALATVVSYKLNLTGPSMSVQTFCSTSLVAVHLACQGLLAGESDMALAGGVSISGQQVAGYLYEEGGIKSPDGHNRSFDAKGKGTVFGNGAGIVVLKRLEDALADGDTIHAVIRGSAVNNDGAQKAGYTAPSVDGQAGAIARALQVSGVNPETIGYVETHGTATSIGDPIEVQGMTKAFRVWTARKQFCPIGSVKSNFGHLDRAAGVAGLMKAVLALEHGQIPPSLHFEEPNPRIDFDNSPFYVNTTLCDFPRLDTPRRAGVSSLGIGGTNAHVIVEEAPERRPSGASRGSQLTVISARSDAALARAGAQMGRFLQQHGEVPLADVAFTLSRGRRAFAHRLAVVGADADEIVTALESKDRRRAWEGVARAGRPVGFLLPGQGTQYVQMGRGLYERERVFRETVDRASRLLETMTGWDLRAVLYPGAGGEEAARERLRQTAVTQPAVFVVGYALAQQWAAWGVRPSAMLGHSLGEYVAACLAGVMELEDALRLVALRGSLMQALPPGVMLAVGLPEADARRYESDRISLATINAAASCVLAGPPDAIAELEARLAAAGVGGRRLETSHAFHSAMMEPMLAPFGEAVAKVALRAPRVPYVSNVTGRWITAGEATDPRYWVRHVRDAVRFADGAGTLLEDEEAILLEVGAGRTLSGLVCQHPASAGRPPAVATLRTARESTDDVAGLQAALGQLWVAGVDVDWAGYWAGEDRRRVPLPTYPFERQRYWLEPSSVPQRPQPAPAAAPAAATQADLADWFYMPAWKRTAAPAPFQGRTGRTGEPGWLVLVEAGTFGSAIVRRLQELGERVVAVAVGEAFRRLHETYFTVRPAERDDWAALFRQLDEEGLMPGRVLSLWNLGPETAAGGALERFDEAQDLGFFALLALAQALGDRQLAHPIHVGVVTDHLQHVGGDPVRAPERATVLGPCKVIPQEYPDLTCVAIDVAAPAPGTAEEQALGAALLAEMASPVRETQVAYRGGHRWGLSYERTRVERPAHERIPIRHGGVYLITGGLGGLGLVLASHLAETAHAKLVLVQRSSLPPEHAWDDWLASHDEPDRTSRRIRRVRELVAKGGEALVLSADVSDPAQMRAAVDRAVERFGPIDGVLHAAGVAGDGVIQLKTREVASAVIRPKVRGGLVLEALFRDRPLDFMMLFSSVASVTGGFGQVDYCGANSFLDVLANGHQAGGGWPMMAVNWDAWSEVGMAVETVQRPTAVPGRQEAPAFEPFAHPYFDRRLVHGDEIRYAGRFSPERIWFLNEHRLFQQPTLPSTAYLELARSAYAPIAAGEPFELRDVFFLTPFAVPLGGTRDLELVLTKREGEHEFVIRSQAPDGQGWQEHCRGRLVAAPDAQPQRYDVAALERACADRELVNPPIAWADMEGRIFKAGGHLDLGPRWYNMERILFGPGRELGIQALPDEIAADVETAPLHPALLDFTALLPLETEGIYIPFSFDCVRVLAPLPSRLCTWVVNRDDLMAGRETVQFDASLMDRSGRGLVEIEGMTLRRIDRLRPAAGTTAGAPPAASVPSDRPLPEAPNVHVAMSAPGLFSSLELRPAARRAPGPGEVEIEVAAAGLNFKDVLRALGMIPDMPGGTVEAGFGAECAGRISAVGAGVSGLEVGDEVMAIAPGAFSAYAVTGAPLVVPIPSGLSYEQAAVVPLVFLTAYHALVGQARLQPGERVLIHAAAGGVGLAAIQIAQHIGAEIFATAGNPAKREYLSSLGVRHVSTSRALSFADDIRSWTNGEGVDVVLNSLSGEFIPASLGLLRAYGRFVEIGARDIYQNSSIGLRPFANNLSLAAVDLGPMFIQRPHAVHRMFEQVAAHFEAGEYQPSPVQSFPIAGVEEAFEFMAGARQIGKLAIHVQTLERRQRPRRPAAAASAAGAAASGMIPPHEGIEAFHRVLSAGRAQLVVSPKNLLSLIDWQRQAIRTLQETAQPAAVQTRVQHPRPELATAFVAPRTEAEQKVAAIWRDLLGLTEIGVHDSFFELGGDSLIGVQVLSRIKKAFNVQLPSSVLYEGPTVESLSRLAGGEDVDESASFAQRRGRAERRRERQPRTHGDS